ncbi:MAG: hypothetical protein IIB72_10460, partial [Proteobacteria bacterium]|nr:hypothetical protein [Pseudomonadota bacterium]
KAIFEGLNSTMQWLHVVSEKGYVEYGAFQMPLTDWNEAEILHGAYKEWYEREHGGSKKAVQSSKIFGEILNENGCKRKYKGGRDSRKWCRQLSSLTGLNSEIVEWLKRVEEEGGETDEADDVPPAPPVETDSEYPTDGEVKMD